MLWQKRAWNTFIKRPPAVKDHFKDFPMPGLLKQVRLYLHYLCFQAGKTSLNYGSIKIRFFRQLTESWGRIVLWHAENLDIAKSFGLCQPARTA